MNYFSVICFVWAAIGIGSRLAMAFMGQNWNKWETESAYKEKRPKWIIAMFIIGIIIIALTWYMVAVSDIQFSWIIAALISLTIIKLSTLIFRYDKFREFMVSTLNNPKKMLKLNISVIIFSIILISMGIWLY